MSRVGLQVGIPVGIGVFAACALGVLLWPGSGVSVDLSTRVPGTDKIGVSTSAAVTDLKGEGVIKGTGVASDWPGVWATFRGAKYDGISTEGVALLKDWPKEGPPRVWSMKAGDGYASPAVLKGRCYMLDYDTKNLADVLKCFSLSDGAEIWHRSYSVDVKRNHGMSRTMPAVTEKYVLTLGPKCHVLCVRAESGELIWSMDMAREYGTTVPPWYAGQCPMIENDRAILAPAGKDCLMVAVECETGKVVWKAPNPQKWEMTHVSIVPMELGGRRQYVYCGSNGVAGVAADDGTILWQTDQWKVKIAAVATPVIIGDGRMFMSGGYGTGSAMMRVKFDGGKYSTEILWRHPAEVFGAEQQTPIFYNGYIYGVAAEEAGRGGFLVCMDLDGKIKWSSGSAGKFGIGPYMIADGSLILMNDTGVVTMVQATDSGFVKQAQASIIDKGHEAWAPLTLAGGRLIVRDMTRMVCLDLRKDRK